MQHILVIDDTPLDRVRLKAILRDLGYTTVTTVATLQQAHLVIETQKISLIIADIFLQGELGTAILDDVLATEIPVIFVTFSKEIDVYKGINNSHLYGYITKPLEPITLHATINLLLGRRQLAGNSDSGFFIRQGNKLQKIPFNDILWLEAEGNYTFINTSAGKHIVKKSLRRMMVELDDRFAQCHKKFCVNFHYVTAVKPNIVFVGTQEIPTTYFFKKSFVDRLHVVKEIESV